MRITNQMMTSSMLGNIMSNKADMNTKFNQYATQQKIQNPSDDPVVAIRALKYRANLLETEQYLGKNVEDARSWMDLTESALKNMNSLLTGLYDKCVAGATDTYDTINRDSMVQQLQSAKEEIYNCLNADNAGRYLFSGYRTNTSVCYTADESSKVYEITEPLSFRNMYEKTYITGGAKYDPNKNAEDYKEMAPNTETAYIMDLGYKDIKSNAFSLQLTDKDERAYTLDKTKMDKDNTVEIGGVKYFLKLTDSSKSDCYTTENGNDHTINVLTDTGQIVVPDKLYETFRTAKNITSTYEKNKFEKGDVRPEMYYDCVSYELNADGTTKDDTRKNYTKPADQDIEYNVNFSQSLKVNVMACETINSAYARSIDNIMEAVNDAYSTQNAIEDVEQMLKDSNNSEEDIEALNTLKEQLETELTLKKEILRESFATAQTTTKAAQNGTIVANADGTTKKISVSIATTSIGSRYDRLDLIANRLTEMQTNYTELRDNNECVELEEAVINYNAAEMTYNASLNAAAQVVKNSLLDFL